MATIHTCDRCGQQTADKGHKVGASVSVQLAFDGWPGERMERVEVVLGVRVHGWEDQPDLCDLCLEEAVLDAVDARRDVRRAARETRTAARATADGAQIKA